MSGTPAGTSSQSPRRSLPSAAGVCKFISIPNRPALPSFSGHAFMMTNSMRKPDLSYDAPMGGDGSWTHAGGYSIWSKTVGEGESALDLWEGRASQAPHPAAPYALHNIAAGTPHRLSHVLGFWRISQGDTIFLKVSEGTKVHYSLALTTGAPQYRVDRLAWYCRRCGVPLRESEFETNRLGLDAFWDWALVQVRAFNADASLRVCANCGDLHVLGYGVAAPLDTPDERSARERW